MPRADAMERRAARHPGDRGRRGHAGQPPRHPRAGRSPRRRRRAAPPRRWPATTGRSFAAIILDRRLPDATAEQLMPRLKAAAPDAAVIVVTGYADLQGAIAALRQGATDYILKPLNADVPPHQPGADRRAAAARAGQGAERGHLPPPGRGRRVHDRDPPPGPHHRLLQPVRRAASPATRPPRSTGAITSSCSCPRPTASGVAAEFVRVIAGSPTRGFENPVVCRDGSRRSMVWNARYLADYEDGPAILEVGQDITFLKQAQERALQAERLAAIGEMVAGLAHESRNALQRSQACLEMLALVVRDRPEALDLIDRHPEGAGPPPYALRGRPRLRRPDQARPAPLRPGARLARGLDPPRAGPRGEAGRAASRRPTASTCTASPTRSASSRSSATSWTTPWRPARPRSPSRSAPRRSELEGQPAIRIACPRQRTGYPARPPRPRSSTRSSPPRPRGPAWAWPSPGGSSRPTAAGSASATATRPGAAFLITLPRGLL